MAYFKEKCIRLVREKLTVFPYGQYTIGIYISLTFRRYSHVRDQCWGLREICKNVTVDTGKIEVPLHAAGSETTLSGVMRSESTDL